MTKTSNGGQNEPRNQGSEDKQRDSWDLQVPNNDVTSPSIAALLGHWPTGLGEIQWLPAPD